NMSETGVNAQIKSTNNRLLESLGISVEEFLPNNIPNEYIQDIQNSTNSGFGIHLSEDDIRNHLFLSDKIFLLKDKGKIIGFSSIKIFRDFTYRYGSAIHKDYQKKGIYSQLNKHVSGKQGFLRTQNQNIIRGLEKSGYKILTGELAYNFMKQKIDEETINNFFSHLDSGVNKYEKGIFKCAYGSAMGNKENVKFIDKGFHPEFIPERGDALLVVYYK
ncbi:MAG: GNAT family N-acetyltransferase, partial [Candidatus Absconditicoccaceae bacterium]